MTKITIAHGSGGKITHKLIKDVFFKYFNNEVLDRAEDSAQLKLDSKEVSFTTDSFVVKPIFFPGGDIGKLAICGTVNDLAVTGAVPKYITCGLIIEEGFLVEDLERVIKSMALWAEKAGVKIVAGDTKVVEKGEADGLFINTSGIGVFKGKKRMRVESIKPGDKVIITGTVGDHGIAILSKRKGLEFGGEILSDAAPLNGMLEDLTENVNGVKFMRDPTRGGLATTLNEIVEAGDFGILLDEKKLPLSDEVMGACELLGLDPLYIANEGKAVIVVRAGSEKEALSCLKKHEYGKRACTVGEITGENEGKVCIKTRYGITRIVDMLVQEQLPRIC